MEVRELTPDDKFNLVYLICLLHGVGVLLPWNMFITAKSYFVDHKLAQLSEKVLSTVSTVNILSSVSTLSSLADETTINSTLSSLSTVSTPLYSNSTLSSLSTVSTPLYSNSTVAVTEDQLNSYQLGYMSATGVAANIPNVLFNGINLFIQSKKGNMTNRITAMIVIECIIFLITIIMIFIDTSNHVQAFYYVTLLTIALMNMANGVYQSSVYGLVSSLPKSYTGAIILGNNLCGILVSIISIISKASSAEPERSAVVYFCSTLAVLIVCLITLHSLKINRYYRHFEELSSSHESPDEPDGEEAQINIEEGSKLEHYKQVLAVIWPSCLNIFIVFFVTLAVFPTVTSLTPSAGQMALGKYFTDVACFLNFAFFAALGSFSPRFFAFPQQKHLWIPIFSRFIFFPFFLMCNYNPTLRSFAVLIPNDWIFTIGVALLGLSSGYFSALVFMYLPNDDKSDFARSCSMLTAFFLVLGVFCGVSFSYIWKWIAT